MKSKGRPPGVIASNPSAQMKSIRLSAYENSGRTLYEVQEVLGHRDPRITQRYAHLSTERLQEAADTAAVIINRASHGES